MGHFSTFHVSLKTETSSLHSEAQYHDGSVFHSVSMISVSASDSVSVFKS